MALASVAGLLRGLDDVSRGFDSRGLTWNDALADPAGATVISVAGIGPKVSAWR